MTSKFLQGVSRIETEVERPGRMIVAGMDRQPIRDDDGTTYYIDLYSADSEIARKFQRSITNRRLAMRGRVKLTAAELEADATELLVALCPGWGSIASDGAVTPDTDFSQQAARTLFSDPTKAELRVQVDEFIADRANFSKASSPSSSTTPNTSGGKTAA